MPATQESTRNADVDMSVSPTPPPAHHTLVVLAKFRSTQDFDLTADEARTIMGAADRYYQETSRGHVHLGGVQDPSAAADIAGVYTVDAEPNCITFPAGQSPSEPFDSDPRTVLKRQLARAEKMGFIFNTGPELEFFLLKTSGPQRVEPLPHYQAGYFDVTSDLAADVQVAWADVAG